MSCKHCGGSHAARKCPMKPTGHAAFTTPGYKAMARGRARSSRKAQLAMQRRAIYRKWQREAGA